LQIGAEIYGHSGLEADAEIQELVLASLALAGISQVRLDLCHVGVLRALIANDTQAQKHEAELFVLLEAKDIPGLRVLTRGFDATTREALLALPGLYGDATTLERARQMLPKMAGIGKALDELEFLVRLAGSASVTIDLADLRGYHYHSGVMFAAYVPGLPNAVARGGRYDHVGEAFGRARPATGFSLDLRELARLIPGAERKSAIRAPWSTEPALREKIADLRRMGEIVIQTLPGHENDQDEFDCDRAIVFENGNWVLKNKLG
ncbi:MAG: ATP phosphoribosyltransferase regulatory subunit, partial [Bacillota bacterium]